jgi:hypothetical protein
MPRGTAHLKEWEQNLISERLDVVYTPRCRCGWALDEMPLRDGRPLAEAHQREQHPEWVGRVRKRRTRPFGQINGSAPLEENIANARRQGASTWVGEE